MTASPTYTWIVFAVVVAAALVLDLAVFHRKSRQLTFKLAVIESAGWIGLALLFNLWVYLTRGSRAGEEFLTGYLVEKSLSVDNIFVFLLIFRAFGIAAEFQHKVLYYGVVGALALRGVFVVAGVTLLRHIHFTVYIFGGILLLTGLDMFQRGERMARPERNGLVRALTRFLPVQSDYTGHAFLVKPGRQWNATPLLVALIAIEAMDIIFAVDSVPAVLAITRDTFIVYSSNAFAILGLRALYFAVADVLNRARFVHQGIATILLFVGAKMLLGEKAAISTGLSLGIIATILAATIAASLLFPKSSAER
jgi:tellurite resistance protein TerC